MLKLPRSLLIKIVKIFINRNNSLISNDKYLKIKTRRQVMERARKALMIKVPKGVSLVDELIKSRREDAKKQ